MTPGVESFVIDILLGAYFMIMGLCFGSFASAIIHREAENRSWFEVKGEAKRSACPNCHHQLNAKDLVPVFSWLYLHGKCRYCAAPVHWSYPALEIICATLAVLLFESNIWLPQKITVLFAIPFLVSFVWLIVFKRKLALRPLILLIILVAITCLEAFF